ncbi:MAG: hypothetical protein HKO65_10465 [Gemmatimonadetes bacterium]|nr:hypothetical protein [Gemmatimonadota bacterium]
MTPKGQRDEVEEKAEAAREAVSWVLRRLDVLEYLILFFAVILAFAGGALVAWLLAPVLGFSFRAVWAAGSILLFILPGGFVYLRELRSRRKIPSPDVSSKTKDPHG